MRIEEKFEELRERGEGAYMPHIYYGDPTEEFSQKQVKVLVENGADLLEFGIPFSDPTADGPTFIESCERALENGITPRKCIQGLEKLREDGVEIPIVVTTYYNIPFVFGIEDFLEELKRVGVQGIIVPNLPVEEADNLLRASEKNEIDVIFQVTPNTSEERLQEIANASSGFLYIINFEGVTGVREAVSDSTVDLIRKVRECVEVPLMAGFGVSSEEHARSLVSAGADGVITGSALSKIYEKDLEHPEERLSEIGEFTRKAKEGCKLGYEHSG